MKIVSHIRSATSMSCVEKITVVPRRFQLQHDVLERLHVDRIEPAERLVENRPAVGSATTAAMNCTFCDMPLESVSTRLSAHGGQAPSGPATRRSPAANRAALRARHETAARRAAAFSCTARAPRADSRCDRRPPRRVPGPARAPCRSRDRRIRRIIRSVVVFPDPFGPDEPIDAPLGNREIQAIHGQVAAKTLADVL